jgi:hypothetical protein
MVRVDDFGERRLVGFVADVGVTGPDQLVAGDPVTGIGHSGKAEIGGVGENDGEQRILVVACLMSAEVGEGG